MPLREPLAAPRAVRAAAKIICRPSALVLNQLTMHTYWTAQSDRPDFEGSAPVDKNGVYLVLFAVATFSLDNPLIYAFVG